MAEDPTPAEMLARQFHEAYERLAPSYHDPDPPPSWLPLVLWAAIITGGLVAGAGAVLTLRRWAR